MEKKIHIKQNKFGKYHIPNKYKIFYGSHEIGELSYKKKDNVFILGYLFIYPEYRKQGLGTKVVEHILFHYKVRCIVGEVLKGSNKFWNKCIKDFNGQRKNIKYCYNTTSSFVIPKCYINNEEMYEFLKIAYDID